MQDFTSAKVWVHVICGERFATTQELLDHEAECTVVVVSAETIDRNGDSSMIIEWVEANLTAEQVDRYMEEIISLNLDRHGNDLYELIYLRHELALERGCAWVG